MNAVVEIQAAIDKLTKLKAASAGGPWTAWHSSTDAYYGNSSVDAPTDDPDNPYMVAEGGERADVDLIVTLHATIDAQLAVLRSGFTASRDFPDPHEWDGASFTGLPGWAAEAKALALPLARAINRATS